MGLLVVAVVMGDHIAPDDPARQDLANRLAPPAWSDGGSSSHLLGTDQLGRDVLSRIIVGARITITIGFAGAVLEAMIGVSLGLVAGYRRGTTGRLIMRLIDIQMGFPAALLLLMIILLFGGSPAVIAVALAANGWMIFSRVVHGRVQQLRTEGFVEFALAAGVAHRKIIARHILPHIRSIVVTLILFEVPRFILAESAMSFIGLGVQPPSISWGLMIGDACSLFTTAPHASLLPGLAIVVTVVSLGVASRFLAARLNSRRSA